MAEVNTWGNAGNTVGTLNGLFKMTYADKIGELIPDGTKIQQMIKFLPKDRQPGEAYNQPVTLQMEHGVTYADDSEGAFNLNDSIAGQMKNATIRGYQLVLRSAISYAAASRAMAGGDRAFEDATKYLVGNMLSSIAKKLEVEILYGQMGLSVVDGAVNSGSNATVPLVAAEFAPGIWAGGEGMPLDVVRAGALVPALSGVNAIVVKAVNLEDRELTIDLPAALQDGDILYAKGAFGKEFAGIHKILTNTGTLFGIDASQYTLWKGTEYTLPTTDVLSFAVIQSAVAKGVEKGLDADVVCLVNPGHWDDLLTEQAALRMFDSSYSAETADNGSKRIKFHSQNGMIEIVPSIYVKEGYAYCLCIEDWARVGSTDVTFRRPGAAVDGEFFRELENRAGYELRCYTDQALFCAKPGRSIVISNLKVS